MTFRKRRGINLPYTVQGYIAFTCWTYARQPPHVQQKIVNLCAECGGQHDAALFDIMTRADMSITQVAMKHFIDESTAYRLRKKFYERWD